MKRIGLLMFALALLLAACAAPAEEGPELTETEGPALTETEELNRDLDEDLHAPAAEPRRRSPRRWRTRCPATAATR